MEDNLFKRIRASWRTTPEGSCQNGTAADRTGEEDAENTMTNGFLFKAHNVERLDKMTLKSIARTQEDGVESVALIFSKAVALC